MRGGNLISPFFYTSEVGYFKFKKKNISQQLDSIKPLHGKKKNKPERDSYDHCIVLSKNNKISLFIL